MPNRFGTPGSARPTARSGNRGNRSAPRIPVVPTGATTAADRVIETVILDVDGTLMDTNYHHVEAWARAFRDLGHQVPRSAIHRQIGKGADQMLPLFVPNEADYERADELHS